MKPWKIIAAAAALGMTIALVGCGHKLVAAQGEKSIPMYPDEQTFTKISQLKQQGGVQGMLGSVGQGLATKQIDDLTPVTVLSSDNNGAQVEITDGPMKGQTGFVSKQNLD
ncbi:MAG: KOW domain-containing RNA-binding protein [Acidimicrobiales bacterium]